MVTLYTQANCQPCKATKRKLENLGVRYTEKRVDLDKTAMQEALATGFQQTPIVVTSDDAWSGHNPTKLNRLKGDQ